MRKLLGLLISGYVILALGCVDLTQPKEIAACSKDPKGCVNRRVDRDASIGQSDTKHPSNDDVTDDVLLLADTNTLPSDTSPQDIQQDQSVDLPIKLETGMDLSTDRTSGTTPDRFAEQPDASPSPDVNSIPPGPCSIDGAYKPVNTVCRGAAGPCDLEEVCNGTSQTCPNDSFSPSTTVCRPSIDENACDPAETCNGTGPACPEDIRYSRPEKPTKFQVDSSNTISATLTWTSGANSTGFIVKRSVNSETNYSPLATPTKSPYLDMNVSGGLTYHYALSATNTLTTCESPNSSPITISVEETGLLGFWRFDETKSPYSDSSGNGYSGTGEGNPTSGVGIRGPHCLSLNGSTQYVSLPSSLPPPPELISHVAWIKSNDPASGKLQYIMGYYDNSNGSRFFITGNTLNFYQGDTTGASGPLPANSAGVWLHVAGTFDGTNWRVYVNGAQVGTATSLPPRTEKGRTWAIGKKPSNNSHYFDGEIDEVRLYRRALNPSEVLSRYNSERQ